MDTDSLERYNGYHQVERVVPFTSTRRFVTYTYMTINFFGFTVNLWVLYVIVPVLFFRNANVPKSILFYILVLCICDIMTMIAMVFLNLDIFFGTWCFSSIACTAYLLFESVNKFMSPIIVLLMSYTCYASICLNARHQRRAASVKLAAIKVVVALVFMIVIIMPVFLYSNVSFIVFNVNETKRQVFYVRKCSYQPPHSVEMLFNFVFCLCSYLIPFCGFFYWYVSVPYFLWKRKRRAGTLTETSTTLTTTTTTTPEISAASVSSMANRPMVTKIPDVVIRKVMLTVLVLSLTYLLCWTPYWVGLYAVHLFGINMSKSIVTTMYFVHVLPYISCAAYPFIFTVMNHAIQNAHSQLVTAQKRRLRNFTRRTSRCLRDALTVENRLAGCLRARLCCGPVKDVYKKTTVSSHSDIHQLEQICEKCERKFSFDATACDNEQSNMDKATRDEYGALLVVENRLRCCRCFVCAVAGDVLPISGAAVVVVTPRPPAFRPPIVQYDEMRAIDSDRSVIL